jgi:hypothetical protein
VLATCSDPLKCSSCLNDVSIVRCVFVSSLLYMLYDIFVSCSFVDPEVKMSRTLSCTYLIRSSKPSHCTGIGAKFYYFVLVKQVEEQELPFAKQKKNRACLDALNT